MKRLLIVTILAAFCSPSFGQTRGNVRPQWPGYYNGNGIRPGYQYNPRSGWNTIRGPNGNYMHYRDGYVPLRPGYRPRYRQYNNNSYSETLGGLIYGW